MSRERWLSEEQLRGAAAAAGHPVSAHQLKRWRLNDLIPRPRQTWPTGKRGSASCYPPGTLDQLCALEELHRTIKLLPDLGFELWWRGFPVLTDKARGWIAQIIEKHTGLDLAREPRDPYDVADEVTEMLRSGEPRDALMRLFRRRVGRNDAALVEGFYVLLLQVFGAQPAWGNPGAYADAADADEPAPEDALASLTGFARAAQDVLPDTPPLLDDPHDVTAVFAQLQEAGALDIAELAKWIEQTTEQELAVAWDDAHVLTELFPEFVRALEQYAGPDFAGLGIFTVARDSATSRFWRALMVCVAIVVRKLVGDDGMAELKDAIRNNIANAAAYLKVIEEFPEYSAYLGYNYEELVTQQSPEFVAKMRKDLTAFLESHPEIRTQLFD
jgi:hypothetical protein